MQFGMMMGVCKCHDNQFWSYSIVESIVTDAPFQLISIMQEAIGYQL